MAISPHFRTLIRLHDTSFQRKSDVEILSGKFSLTDAQRIVAREYSYSSWATLNVSEETMQLVQKQYDAEVEKRATDKGVWHDMTQYYIYGQKL